MVTTTGRDRTADPQEALRLAGDLIRIDTTNTGDPAGTVGERAAAEYVARALDDVGIDAEFLEGGAPGRANVVARIPGRDPRRGALLVHAHLDVVPAVAADWSVHPLSGEVAGGMLWGRGAADLKGPAAMMLTAVRRLARAGTAPARDVVLAFLADEETGGVHGARWLAEHRRDLFDGVTEAVGEVGGFSVTLPGGQRVYLVQTAEKSAGLLRLRATGTAGHGSIRRQETAVATLADAVTRLHAHRFPAEITPPAAALLDGLDRLTGHPYPRGDADEAARLVGPALARIVDLTLQDTVNVTRLAAGYASNVVPGEATAVVDCRVLPGRAAAFERELATLLDGLKWELTLGPGAATGWDGALPAEVTAAVLAEDPDAVVLPYLLPASTDAKTFAGLGIRCFGFTPLRLPPGYDYPAVFHAVDEHLPVEALSFGTDVLERLLRGPGLS
jgi:acetylornithine deacetylase/succinyl-diaminopimelate desuccinylase-like protein